MKANEEGILTAGDGASKKPDLPRTDSPQGHSRKKFRHTALLLSLSVAAALLVIGIIFRTVHRPAPAAGGPRAGSFPVPVVAGVVTTRDVPIYLNGLGTVQAFNTVTVHSRVDGQLIEVRFKEGQDVKAGEVLAQIDPAPYQAAFDQATAKKAQDEALLANARVDLQRYTELLKSESTTQQTYDTQKALVDQLTAASKTDEAAIATARVNLDYTTIHAPIDGRVGLRLVDAGNVIRASDANGMVVLAQLRPISVVFTLPEQALTQLQPEHEIAYDVLAVARDNTNVLAVGKLAVVDNQIDTATGTIRLKATFSNDNLRLWPGQFVNTRLHLHTETNGVIVAASVVQRGPEGPFAFIINEDQSVSMRPLQVAQIENGLALIQAGLAPGEQVVVDGQYKLQNGSRVKPVASATSSPGSPAEPPAKAGARKKP